MSAWLDAFVPVFGLLGLGALLKRLLLQDDSIWAGIERLIFWVLLPCLLVNALSSVNLRELPVAGMAGAIWGALLLGTALSIALARLMGHGHAAMTSIMQGGIRYNTVMGFAIAGAVWGAPGLTVAALTTGLIVPCVQVLVTLIFALGRSGRIRLLPLLRQLALNPLLLACVLGFVISLLGGLPPGVLPAVRGLGQASVALGLLCVGAALALDTLWERVGTQLATAVLKLMVVPAITWALCLAFGLSALPTAIAVTFMALPTAATSYVVARAMGGDAPLMAAITNSEHLLAVLTLPLWVAWVAF